MNIKWLKQNAVIIGFIAAFLIVLGGLIWLWQSAASKSAEVDTTLEEQRSQYDHFSTQKPTPSQENINLLKKQREEVDHLYQQLLATVGRSQIPTQADLRPVTFLQQMASQVSRLRQAATNNNVKVAEGFAFGFGRYAGPPPQLPAKGLSDEETKNVLTLLVKQLHAIEHISLLLMSSHVEEINQIRHSEAEPGGGNSTEAFDMPVNNDPKALYQVLPFEFQFTCTGEALRAFLNSLTASEWFFAVRSVKVVGEAPSISSPTASPAPATAPAAPTPMKLAHLSVTMRIDLIEFSTNQPPQAAAGKPGA